MVAGHLTKRNGYYYVWIYTVNGVEPQDKRAFEIEVHENDHIVYYLIPTEDESLIETEESGSGPETAEVIDDNAGNDTGD